MYTGQKDICCFGTTSRGKVFSTRFCSPMQRNCAGKRANGLTAMDDNTEMEGLEEWKQSDLKI